MLFTLFVGFVIGALVVIGIEVFGVWFLIQKLSKKGNEDDVKVSKSGVFGRDEQLQFSFPNKQVLVYFFIRCISKKIIKLGIYLVAFSLR